MKTEKGKLIIDSAGRKGNQKEKELSNMMFNGQRTGPCKECLTKRDFRNEQ